MNTIDGKCTDHKVVINGDNPDPQCSICPVNHDGNCPWLFDDWYEKYMKRFYKEDWERRFWAREERFLSKIPATFSVQKLNGGAL